MDRKNKFETEHLGFLHIKYYNNVYLFLLFLRESRKTAHNSHWSAPKKIADKLPQSLNIVCQYSMKDNYLTLFLTNALGNKNKMFCAIC